MLLLVIFAMVAITAAYVVVSELAKRRFFRLAHEPPPGTMEK